MIVSQEKGGSENAIKTKRGRKPIEVPKLQENIEETIEKIEANREKYKQNPNPNKKEHKKTLDAFAKHLRTLRKRINKK